MRVSKHTTAPLTFGVVREAAYHVHVSVERAACLLKATRTVLSELWKIDVYTGHLGADVSRAHGTCSVRVYCV